MMISGQTSVAAVIGWPVEHSLSPVIHNAWFAHIERDWAYVALPVEPDALKDAINGVRALGVQGLSVTMPHKEAILAHLDEVDDLASALHAVNCVAIRDGILVGTNTDGDGCCDAIEQHGTTQQGTFSLERATVSLLGAGGAARAIAIAMMRRGAHIRVINRTDSRTQELIDIAREMQNGPHVGSVLPGTMSDIEGSAVVINATSVGMGSTEHPCDVDCIASDAVVLDAVYSPLRTSWLDAARDRGCTTIDGLWMLIHQAARQQRWWFGDSPDPAVMRIAAEHELARRRQ